MNELANPLADQQLARARAGDVAAFERIVRDHQRSVHSLALRMLGNREAADDLAQEVFLQLHQKLSQVESATHLKFWLRRVVTHRAIDRLRTRPPFSMTCIEDEPEIAGEELSSDPLLQQRLRQLLGELPAAARAVLLLRYQEDLDPLDIAQTLEMPINTVKSHLKRSLAALRERIAPSREVAFEEYGYE